MLSLLVTTFYADSRYLYLFVCEHSRFGILTCTSAFSR